MNVITGAVRRQSALAFLWERKWWRLVPVIVMLLLFGGMIFFTRYNREVSCVYMLF